MKTSWEDVIDKMTKMLIEVDPNKGNQGLFVALDSARRIIKAEVRAVVKEEKKAAIKELKLPDYDHSKCIIKASCIGYQGAESDLENIKEAKLADLERDSKK
jgi:hypothetical protein